MNYIKGNPIYRSSLYIFLFAFGIVLATGPARAEGNRSAQSADPVKQTWFSHQIDEMTPPGSGELEEYQPENSDAETGAIAVCNPDIPNMVGYWPLDDQDTPVNNKLTFVNYMGTSNGTCTIPGCPTRSTGKVNGAYTFLPYDPYDLDPDLPDKIDVAKFPALEWANADSFSFETWVKIPASTNCSGNKVFIGERGGGVMSIWLGCAGGANHARFSVRDNTGVGTISVEGTTALNDGDWHHVVGVRDAAADKLHIYVDGSLEKSVNALFTAGFKNSAGLGIGYFNTGFPPFYYLHGTLDEVAVYQRALTLANVKAHYNGGDGKSYCSPGPVVTNPGNRTNKENDVVSLQIQANDQEDGTLNFSAPGLPPTLGIGKLSGLISGQLTCSASTGSPYSVTVTAKNITTGKSGSAAFSWTVTDNPACDAFSGVFLPITIR